VVDRDSKDWVREIRSSSTPRKKVINDDNWKVKIKSKEPRSSNATPRQKSGTPEISGKIDRACSPAEIEREERRRRRREARKARLVDDERLREIYGTSKPRTSDPEPPCENPETQSNVDSELARRFTRPTKDSSPVYTPNEQDFLWPEEDDGRHRRRSRYAESLGTGPESSDVRIGEKSRKGSIFSKTKEIFSKTELPPPASNRLPSIEAWLQEQPDDPFVEGEEAPVEVPPPLKPRTRRRVSAEAKAKTTEDPNKIWENVPKEVTPPDQRRKRKSKDPAQAPPYIAEDTIFTGCVPVQDTLPQSPDQSQAGLKRMGARISRLRDKSSRKKELTPEPLSTPPPKVQSSLSPVSEMVDSYMYHHQGKLSPEVFPERPCPRTGNQQLSTIASVETFSSKVEAKESDGPIEPNAKEETWDFLKLDANGLKRRLTTNEDLMSQLSLPTGGRNLRKSRSKRSARTEKSNMTTQEVFDGIKADEAKYSRELRTLVDGVIPVLLQCILSKSDSIAAAGIFKTSAGGKDVTKPIVDMGIALERLKSLHNRIPADHLDALLSWAQTAHKAYSDYLKAWRLGFQDVVVNLATKDGDASAVDKGMPRDQDGDVVTAEGKKVDVAYLLKRPLVRVKKLSRSFEELKLILNTGASGKVANMYDDLTELARKRTQEEQGRLEDEAACNIDVTKARDLRTMAVLTGIAVDKSRKVKAKDCFAMTLYHTSGQRVDCRIEVILRDNQSSLDTGGDVLFCEVDDTGKWLLFPPVDTSTISARKGDKPEDLVVMVKGTGRQAWHEMLELRADDTETATDWMTMLGSNPLPPKLVRSLSFLAREETEKYASETVAKPLSAEALKAINGSDIEVPFGEPSLVATMGGKKRQVSPQRPNVKKAKLNLGGGLHKSTQQNWLSPTSSRVPPRKPVGSGSVVSSDKSITSGRSTMYSDSSYTPTMSSTSVVPNFQNSGQRPETTPRKLGRTDDMSREWITSPELREAEAAKGRGDESPKRPRSHEASPQRPNYKRELSSAPSKDLPTIPRVRVPSGQKTSTAITNPTTDQWASMSGVGKEHKALASRDGRERRASRTSPIVPHTEDVPPPPAHSKRPTSMPAAAMKPQSPAHKETQALQPLSDNLLAPQSVEQSRQQTDKKAKRRSSSPLKHEYAPSVASSDDSDGSESDASDYLSEDEDTPTPLVSAAHIRRPSRGLPPSAFRQVSSSKAATLAPSDSASQAPYRSVPSVSASDKRKAIAMVCTWSDVDMWVPVNPSGEICSVVVSPGLVEVFEMSETQSKALGSSSSPASSRENSLTLQPLVGFELTINVMMHGGTSLDITLRSPPTPNSRIKSAGSTVLFRSSSMAEKQLLYNLLNHARMNNPTMLALMAARAKRERTHPPAVSFAVDEPARHSRAGSFGIFSFGRGSKGSSYRASSADAPPSISGETTESTGSTSRSLLKRLQAGSAFALNRSSVHRKTSGTVTSSSLSGSSTPVHSQSGVIPANGPSVPTTSNAAVEGAGMVNNMKVRLHIRERNLANNAKWVDLGAVRLSILPASTKRSVSATGAEQSPPESGSNTPTRPISMSGTPRMPSATQRLVDPARSKRIVIVGTDNMKAQRTFLDAVLPEAAFARVMRIGIAINVWKEEETIAKQGGVLLGKNTVWCVSFGSERECSWVFGLVGRYQYE
jgi:hypothetical protein